MRDYFALSYSIIDADLNDAKALRVYMSWIIY